MDSLDKTYERCLKEMFKRVGEKYPNKKLTEQKDWYLLRTWTEEEEISFGVWMEKFLKKKYPGWSKKRIGKTRCMFNLMWGWKTAPTKGKE